MKFFKMIKNDDLQCFLWSIHLFTDWLIDCSFDCLIVRLIDWSIALLIVWLIDWLIALLIDWLIDCSFDWLIDWLIDRLFDDWLIDWLIDISYAQVPFEHPEVVKYVTTQDDESAGVKKFVKKMAMDVWRKKKNNFPQNHWRATVTSFSPLS